MKKKGQMSNEMVIALLVFIVLAIALYATVAELISQNVEPQAITNEAVTASNSSAVSLANNNLAANATCNCTDYTTNLGAGTVLWGNDTCNGQTSTCSYTYFAGGYVESSTSRSILDILPLLFIVGIFIAVVIGLGFMGRR